MRQTGLVVDQPPSPDIVDHSVGWSGKHHMDDRKRKLSFIQVLTESLLFSVLK